MQTKTQESLDRKNKDGCPMNYYNIKPQELKSSHCKIIQMDKEISIESSEKQKYIIFYYDKDGISYLKERMNYIINEVRKTD